LRRLALLASLALASCSSGFGVSIMIDPGCVTEADKATFSVSVRLDPSGGSADQTITSDDFFTAGKRRVVVVPPDGTTTITITVDAINDAGSLASGSATVSVDGHQIATATIVLAGCPGRGPDAGVPGDDGPRKDGSLVDLAPMCHMDQDCANLPGTPVCDPETGTCVPCLVDKSCPLGEICKQKACVTGCAQDHGCANNITCNLDAGLCACMTPQDCGGGTQDCCNGVCVDTSSDPNHCGSCMTSCNGMTCCASKCVDLTNNLTNCGACGNSCKGLPNTMSTGCVQSKCALTCNGGYADCDKVAANGCEINILNDVQNCNGCGNTCMLPNTDIDGCSAGKCTISQCTMGYQDCDGMAGNGCEINITNDVAHCNGCMNSNCKTKQHVLTAACQMSACVDTSCVNGYTDCNNDGSDGCETNTGTDPNNCGGCGFNFDCNNNVLQNTHGDTCSGGVCMIGACNMGWMDCDNMNPGCETNTDSDTSNCGACGFDCSVNLPPHSTSADCEGGQCHPLNCQAGWGNCDGVNANGCEDQVSNDPMNCGGCGNNCNNGMMMMFGNLHVANWGCGNNQCKVQTCDAGYADCDGNPMNGCEVNINLDAFNCGGCNKPCGMGHYCSGAACKLSYTCPEIACGNYNDPVTGAPFTTCGTGFCPGLGTVRLSGSGMFYVDYVCQQFGFMKANQEWGDCTTCGGCMNNGTCMNPAMGFMMGAFCMPDGNTLVCMGQLSWNCK
jgi:hypothetical protein